MARELFSNPEDLFDESFDIKPTNNKTKERTLAQFPDLLSISVENKKAVLSQAKKDYHKNKNKSAKRRTS